MRKSQRLLSLLLAAVLLLGLLPASARGANTTPRVHVTVKQRVNGRLRSKPCSAKPTYHAGISDHKICSEKYRANEPDKKHRTDARSIRCRFCDAVGRQRRKRR